MPASGQLLLLLVLAAAFWLVAIRPARSQQKRLRSLQQELEVGQLIVLSAGIFGTVRSLEDQRVKVEIAPGTVITVARQAVVRRAEELDVAGSTHDDRPGDRPADRPDEDQPHQIDARPAAED